MKLKFVIVMLGVLLFGCEKQVEEIIRPVETTTVSPLPERLYFEYPAIVTAKNESILSFKVAGPIEKISVDVGSFVKKGEVIAQLDKRDYEVQLKSFESKSKVVKNAVSYTHLTLPTIA